MNPKTGVVGLRFACPTLLTTHFRVLVRKELWRAK